MGQLNRIVVSGGGGGGGYSTIESNGTPLPQENTINFTGTGLNVTDSSGVSTNVSLSGSLQTLAGITPSNYSIIAGNGSAFYDATQPDTPTIYVDNTNGDDATGNGSKLFPFKTIYKANSAVTGASGSNPIVIRILAGHYNETQNILLKPFVYYQGDGSAASYITSPNKTIGVDPSFNTGSGRTALIGITVGSFGGANNIDFDLDSLGSGNSGVLELWNSVCNGNITFTGRVAGADEFFMLNSYAFGDMQLSNCAGGQLNGSFIEGNLTVDTANTSSANSNVTFQCFAAHNWSFASTGSLTNVVTVNASSCFGSMSITGSGTTVSIDAVSLPSIKSDLTVVNATVNYITGAYGVSYTPAVPSDWSPAPGFVNTALDQLAARPTGGTGFTWNTNVTSSASMVSQNGYVTTSASLITLTLPTTITAGQIIEVANAASGGWKIAQNAGQSIIFGNKVTTTGSSGEISSTALGDTVRILCITTNTTFQILSSIGNLSLT